MPGGDRTGPVGMGPMTGRGLGYCAGYANPAPGRGFGLGRGWGRGRGRSGRSFGRGWATYPYAEPYPYPAPYYPAEVAPKQEAAMLKEQAKAMQGEIDAIHQRIKDLESAQASENKG